jgi:hypothetical protein
MSDNNPFQPLNQPKKSKPKLNQQSFVEALKNVGSGVASTVKDEVIKPIAIDAWDSLVKSPGSSKQSESKAATSWDNEWLKQREEEIRAQERAKRRHQELLTAKPLFDRQAEETKAQIKAIQDELRALAKDMAGLGSSLQQAIEEEIVNPGTYHVSFFEKLRTFIVSLRKQVNESANWLEASSARKAAKNSYWGSVKKHGTKFMLSDERSKATQAG